MLNGEPYEVAAPVTVSELLVLLRIDSRRVAVEHNLVVLRRALYDTTELAEGDQVEIVNFVGGGEGVPKLEVRSGKAEVGNSEAGRRRAEARSQKWSKVRSRKRQPEA